MSLSLCVLASGSQGNSVYVASDQTRILVDAGLSGRETAKRLDQIGVAVDQLAAVCLTHEHGDHRKAVRLLHTRHQVQLFANQGTVEALDRDPRLADCEWQVFTNGFAFMIGDLTIEPFSVPHDAYDPVGFVVRCGDQRIVVGSDMGALTDLIRERVRGANALVLECNYDRDMLRDSDRPWSLKQRIAGRQGHLSNDQAAELLQDAASPDLRCVFLSHLSEDCNTPAIAMNTARAALREAGHPDTPVHLSHSDRPSDLVTL